MFALRRNFASVDAFITQQRKYIQAVLFLFVSFAVGLGAYTFLGDYTYQISEVFGDDLYSVHAYVLDNIELFKEDLNAVGTAEANKYTLMVMTARFFKFILGIDYDFWFAIFVVMQSMLLFWGVYTYTATISNSKISAYLAGLSVVISSPSSWGLALFMYIGYYPYPGNIALGFALLSCAFYLRKSRLYLLFVLMAGLSNPLQAGYLVLFLFVFMITQAARHDWASSYAIIKKMAWLTAVSALFFAYPAFYVISGEITKSSASNTLMYLPPRLTASWHIEPWLYSVQGAFAMSCSVYIALLFLGFFVVQRKILSRELYLFLCVVMGCSVLFPFAHIVFATGTFAPILAKLILLRSSQMFILLLIPLFLIAWQEIISKKRFETTIIVSFFMLNALFRMSPHNIFFLVLALFLSGLSSEKDGLRYNYFIVFLPFFGLIDYTFLLPEGMGYGFDFVPSPSSVKHSALCYAAGFSVFFSIGQLRRYICTIVIVILAVLLLRHNDAHQAFYQPTASIKEKYSLKKWAADNTAPSDLFINLSSLPIWRTVSRRPITSLSSTIAFSVYGIPARLLIRYNNREILLRSIFGDDYANVPAGSLKPIKILEFAKKIGAHYILTDSTSSFSDLPIVYSCDNYLIQKIPPE